MDERDELGRNVTDDILFLALNAEPDAVRYVLPAAVAGLAWEVVLDTTADGVVGEVVLDRSSGTGVLVPGRAVVLLRARPA
jgi:hypothetical protein